jgi:hypothetical protein
MIPEQTAMGPAATPQGEFTFVLTHDVHVSEAPTECPSLTRLERSLGFRPPSIPSLRAVTLSRLKHA